jgi:hypothetical protein
MNTTTKSRKAQGAKTHFVMVTTELQIMNAEVTKAYELITKAAIELMKRFDLPKYRTWIDIDHTKDPQNTTVVREFICHFWNVTLSTNKDGRLYIFIDIDEVSLSRLGNNLTNTLLRRAFQVTVSKDETQGIEYALRVNYTPTNIQNFFYRRIVDGDTETSTVTTEEKDLVD